MKESIIYTLGTSTHSKEEFLDLLKYYHIETVVDVRSFPQSRFEHFKKESLVEILKEGGVKLWNSIHLCYQLSEAIFPHASDKPVLLSQKYKRMRCKSCF